MNNLLEIQSTSEYMEFFRNHLDCGATYQEAEKLALEDYQNQVNG